MFYRSWTRPTERLEDGGGVGEGRGGGRGEGGVEGGGERHTQRQKRE